MTISLEQVQALESLVLQLRQRMDHNVSGEVNRACCEHQTNCQKNIWVLWTCWVVVGPALLLYDVAVHSGAIKRYAGQLVSRVETADWALCIN